MRQAMRVWMKVAFYVMIWAAMFNIVSDIKGTQYLKQDLTIAVHDATLQLDETQIPNGKRVFDRTKAFQAFINSFEHNTKLTYNSGASITPNSNSFFQDEFRIITFEYIDDSNATFPYAYNHPVYDMQVLYHGPTIVAVVETYGPRHFIGDKTLLRRATSYTIK